MDRIGRKTVLASTAMAVALAACLLTGCASLSTPQPQRDAEWALPCKIDGVENCFMLEPGLYRAAQPSAQGMASLERMGIRNVLSLRHGSLDNRLARDTLIQCHHVTMNAFKIEEEELLEALAIMVAPRNRPLLVHCFHGADRTGVLCAAYRVVVQNWTKDKAIDEMERGQYGFHSLLLNAASSIRNLDVEKARQRLGLPPDGRME